MFDLVKYYMNKGKGGYSGSSSNEYDLTGVSVGSFAAAALVGLGLMPTPGNGTPFNNLVDQTSQFLLSVLGSASAGVIQLVSPVPGKYYVDREILLKVRDWLFSSGIISRDFTSVLLTESSGQIVVPSYSSFGYSDASAPVFVGNYIFYQDGWSRYRGLTFAYSQGYFKVYNVERLYYGVNGAIGYSKDELVAKGYTDGFVGSFPSADDAALWLYNNLARINVDTYPSGITLTDVVPEIGTDIEINYIDWAELEKQLNSNPTQEPDPDDPNEKTYPFWPIFWPTWHNDLTAVPSDPAADAVDISQTDIWTEGSDPSWNPGGNIENKNSSPILWWGKTK